MVDKTVAFRLPIALKKRMDDFILNSNLWMSQADLMRALLRDYLNEHDKRDVK